MKLISICKSKIHRATITQCDLNYVGSVTVDADLLDAAGIFEGEEVRVWNVDNGERLETYAIAGERGSGVICLNGAAAHKAKVGDRIIIAAFCLTDEPENVARKVVLVDGRNKITGLI
ncbi:MAG: aspartate 1-decarboxylase [Abditibacteriota bacterium]|nr:aspartate 1-decarboxylase [Abditibacteriota bacterium]